MREVIQTAAVGAVCLLIILVLGTLLPFAWFMGTLLVWCGLMSLTLWLFSRSRQHNPNMMTNLELVQRLRSPLSPSLRQPTSNASSVRLRGRADKP